MQYFSLTGLLTVSALLTLSCGVEEAPTNPSEPFVRVDGMRFMIGDRPFYPCGVNFWAAMNLAVDGPEGDRSRLLAELDQLRRLGVNHLRVMASSEGPDTAPYRVVPSLMPTPGEYNKNLLEALDFLLAECGKRDIRLVMVVTNFWEWSGGMAQYVSWHEDTPIPYPATHVWTDFTAYASKFYGCPQCQDWYRDHIRMVISRVNENTGISYRDDPTIFAWELANEPRLYPQEWIDDTAAFIKSLDSNHLVTTGSEGEVGGPFTVTHGSPDIDYATLHIWPQNWGWFDPMKPESYEQAQQNALAYLNEHVAEARVLGKPLILEEFGLARDWFSAPDRYAQGTKTTLRNLFFTAMFRAVAESVRAGGPLTGDSIWAWGGRGRPGDRWTGDPPHEPAGWYSVFDSDLSTLEVISAHAQDLERLNQR